MLKEHCPSIDELLMNEGYAYWKSFDTAQPQEILVDLLTKLKANEIDDYRIVPCDLAREGSSHRGRTDGHSIYTKPRVV